MYDLLLHHENILDYVGSGGEMQNILWRNLLSHIIKCHGDLILISCYDEYICCLHIFMGHPWVNAINQNGGKTMALDDIFCSDDFYSFWKTKNFPLNILRIAQFLLQRIIKSPQNIYLPQKTFSFAIHRNRLTANQSFFLIFFFVIISIQLHPDTAQMCSTKLIWFFCSIWLNWFSKEEWRTIKLFKAF